MEKEPPSDPKAPQLHSQSQSRPIPNSLYALYSTLALARKTQATDYSVDHSQLRPLLSDFENIEKDPRSKFPHKFMVFNGNNGAVISNLTKYRGFNRVTCFINKRSQPAKKTPLPL